MIELKEVGNAGMLLRISLTVNGVEAYFQDISDSDNWITIKKKREELRDLAEFTSLGKPDWIWAAIRDGSFQRYLENYQ